MPLAPGDVFAGYTVIRQIGTGGMGEVYLVRHPRLPRNDALKLLNRELSSEPDFVARFMREADIVSGLSHHNIVSIYDRGDENGQLWLTMRYVDGIDAEDALAQAGGLLPAPRAVHIVGEVAAALDAAHRRHLIHRDVKPANVLLCLGDDDEPEQVFLTDFGIAKSLDAGARLTRTGLVVATFDYASPEQIEAQPLDARSDVYSLGCVLYKLLTGSVPFPGETMLAPAAGHLSLPPPRATALAPWLAPGLDDARGTAQRLEVEAHPVHAVPGRHLEGDRPADPARDVGGQVEEPAAPQQVVHPVRLLGRQGVAADRWAHRQPAGEQAQPVRRVGRRGQVGERGLGRHRQGPAGGVAVVGLLRHRPGHDVVQTRGQPRHRRRGARRGQHEVAVHDPGQAARVRRLAGEQGVQHAAQGVDVRAAVERPGLDLLGGGVGEGGQDHAGAGQLGVGRVERLGDPEVGEEHLLGFVVGGQREQDVRRLDVAVDQLVLVRGVEGRGHLRDDPHRPLGGQQAARLLQGRLGVDAVDVGHGQPQAGRVLAPVEHRHDVAVGEPGDDVGLAQEPRGEVGIAGEVGPQQLQRVHPGQPRVADEVDGAHAARAEPAHHRVPGDDVPGGERHGGPPVGGWGDARSADERVSPVPGPPRPVARVRPGVARRVSSVPPPTLRPMRLLHTSDWHIGRSLHGTELLADQEAVLSSLAGVVTAEGVDAVVVAGDVYDRAVPSADAQAVLDRVVGRLLAAGAAVVLTPGNHDSARRLGTFSGLLAQAGLHVRAATGRLDEPVLLADAHGEVAVYGLPYLEPEVARAELGIPGARGHAAVLRHAMDRVRADLFLRPGARSVVLAHAFVGGGVAGDSERDICVGGVDLVPPDVFDGVDYVALGHLHRPQSLSPRLRYSGSPLAYSFGEAGQAKQAWLVELDAHGLAGVREVPLPTPRPLAVLTGTLAELLEAPEHAAAEDSFVSARLTDPVRPVDPMRRLQTRFPWCVHLEWTGGARDDDGRSYRERLRGRSDLAVAEEFVTHVRGTPAGPAERELLARALGAADREAAAR